MSQGIRGPLKGPKTVEQENHWLHQLGRRESTEGTKMPVYNMDFAGFPFTSLPFPSRALTSQDLPGFHFLFQLPSLSSITHVLLPRMFTWNSVKTFSPLGVLLVLLSPLGLMATYLGGLGLL